MIDYLRFAGTEVVNHERLAAYVANGIAPGGGTTFDIPVCDGLSEVLYPSGDFTTPLQDQPPWYDADDPDTWDFAGILALEVTGLNATTRTVAMTQTIKGNGLAGRAVRGPQTVGVTAVLVGRTTAGVNAGLAWLRRVLHGSCDADEQPCGQSGSLETFTVCPTPVGGAADLSAPISTTILSPADGGDEEAWLVLNGTFAEDGDPGTVLRNFTDVDTINGGTEEELPDSINGGGEVALEDLIIGSVQAYSVEAIVAGPQQECTAGPVTITWTLRSETGVRDVVPALLDAANTPVFLGGTWEVDTTDSTYVWDFPVGVDMDEWRPALISSDVLIVGDLVIDAYATLDPLECLAPYRRFFPVTATTSGPTPTAVLDTDCAELLTVEWVWESGSPYRYGVRTPLLLGLGFEEEPSFTELGVAYDVGGPGTIAATPWNCTPVPPVDSCAIDPAAPVIGVPPAYPVIVDTTRPRITTQQIRDFWALVNPELIPSNEGVFTIELIAGSAPVVGARVRVWDDADALGVVPDPCDFAYEFLIDYIPANGVMTIDGAAGTITTLCNGDVVSQDAASGVRGAFGGPVEDPVVRCDRRYLVRVQQLDTFPRTAAPFYVTGGTEGDLTINLYVTTREG